MKATLGTNDLGITAFGQQKVSIDKSSFHMLYTYDVSRRGSKEMLWNGSDYIEQTTFSNVESIKGGVSCFSGDVLDQRVQIRSLQHVRYQPNRGYLLSASLIFPNPTDRGTRMFGSFIPCNGVWVEVVGDGTDYRVYFVVRNHWLDDRTDITKQIPTSVDISKGNLWDIQMEWRGVGDMNLAVNQEIIYTKRYLGKLDYVSIENPSLPVSMECRNEGDNVELRMGCVDVSMEGGEVDQRFYGSVSTGTTLINASANAGDRGTAVVAFRLPKKIPYGEVVDPSTGLPDAGGTNEVCYSRDLVLDAITTFCKDESFTVISASRGVYVPAIAATSGWTRSTDSYVEYLIGGDNSDLNDAFQIDKDNMRLLHASRHEKDFAAKLPSPNPSTTPFTVTSDSYVIVSLKPDGNGQSCGVNIEFSEQI